MNPYFERQILDADPVQLVRLLYQRAISSIAEAREHLAKGRTGERARAINRAYSAVAELRGALRQDAAPDLAGRLNSLYAYVQRRLTDANFRQEDRPLVEALNVLVTLLEGWNGLASTAAGRTEQPGAWPADQRAEAGAATAGV